MKKLALAFAAVATLAATPALAARGDTWWGGALGVDMPFGDFADDATIGYNIGATGDYMMSDVLAVGGEISYHTFGGNDDLEKRLTAQFGTPIDLRIRMTPFIVHAKYLLPSQTKIAPFIKGGLGIYNVRSSTQGGLIDENHSETVFGFLLGGGVNFKTGTNFVWGGELMYHYIGTEGAASNMLTLRGTVNFGFTKSGTPAAPPATTPPSTTP